MFIFFLKILDNKKDKWGIFSYDDDNFYLSVVVEIKVVFLEVCLISDVVFDFYSLDGYDGIVYDGKILNDEILYVL